LKFEQLRQKYAALGYFDSNRKRPLPKFVGVVGVITSISAGIVLADFVFWWQILFPKTKLIVVDVSVQGAGSAHAVSRAIQFLNELKEIEVILIMRGGGSLADLWTFNEPTVIEAIFNSSKPIVTAIGHEADTTLADMVADVRAPTPTSAASQILPNREHFLKLIKVKLKNLISNDFTFVKMRDLVFLDQTFTAKVSDKLSYLKSNLNNLNKLLSNLSPESYLNFRVHRLKNLFKNFCFEYTRAMSRFRASLLSVQNKLLQIDTTSHLLNKSNSFIRNLRRSEQLASQLFLACRDQLDRLQTKLHLCSPLEPLSRGFSLVVDSYGKVLSFSDLRTNQVIKVLFDEGDISARITEKNARSARRSYKESFKD
ncbi:MAG: exodeoxyribonuclease VII large subunit, partial [Deltaproteobacteria bacterium]|nr:exodeoxyribonuclease VII large subunit [Deltaproteobacteria bacterium]